MHNPIRTIRRTRPARTGIAAPLGELELSVMRQIWNCGTEGCLGAEVQSVLEKSRPTALTTVLTTLDRLLDKGILRRDREGKAYRYRALLSEEQLQQRIVDGVMSNLIAQFPSAVATYLAQQGLCGCPNEADKLTALAARLESMQANREASGPVDPGREAALDTPAGEGANDD